MFMKARFVLLVIAALLFPTPARAAATQEITFGQISNRTTAQALSFDVAPTVSSGLTVSVSASGACSVSNFTVSVLDKGNCTLIATQAGNEEWAAAVPVSRSFEIARGFFSRKTVQFVTSAGSALKGLEVEWRTPDSSFKSATKSVSDSAGRIVFGSIPGGPIIFKFSGKVGDWEVSRRYGSKTIVRAMVGEGMLPIEVGPSAADSPRMFRVQVSFADGVPIPNALVSVRASLAVSGGWACISRNGWYLSTGCVPKTNTDLNGMAVLVLPAMQGDLTVFAQFTDGEIVQTSGMHPLQADDTFSVIQLEAMPVVVIETPAALLNYGAAQTVTALAQDSAGFPVAGRSLTLSASTSGASASCSGRKTTATTNSSGRAIFKVCPVKTATWSVDGQSIVGSAGVRLTVQLTPTAPRTLVATAKTRSVSLAWVTPVKANAGSVTDYIVQYRLQGATTWMTFRDGTSTARKATVSGLTSGQVYEFRVAAKNKSGTGTWGAITQATVK